MKHSVFTACCLVVFFSVVIVYSQGGFKGPNVNNVNSQIVTVKEVHTLADDTKVTLKGSIIQSIGRKPKYYMFRDATGEITVEIEKKVWGNLSVTPSDTVEISGEVEVEDDGRREIEVKSIRKL